MRIFSYTALIVALMAMVSCKKGETQNDKTTDSNAVVTPPPPATTTVVNASGDSVKVPVGDRIAYINSMEIIEDMPERKAADKKLEGIMTSKQGSLQEQGKKLQPEYEKLMTDLQQFGDKYTEAERNSRIQKLQEMEQQMGNIQANAEKEFAKEKEKAYLPLQKKMDDAIKAVAKENGFAYVLDNAFSNLAYADTTRNITSLVRVRLGMKAK